MAVKLGNDYLLWVESGTPGTYNYIAGQGNLSKSRSNAVIDTSSKTSGNWVTSAVGRASGQLQIEIIVNLPDANGYERLETLCKALPQVPFNIQVRKDGTAGASDDKVFEASVYCSQFDDSLNQDDTVKVSATLVYASAPSTDLLA